MVPEPPASSRSLGGTGFLRHAARMLLLDLAVVAFVLVSVFLVYSLYRRDAREPVLDPAHSAVSPSVRRSLHR